MGPMDLLSPMTQGAAWVFWPFCLELPEYFRSLISPKQMLEGEEEQSHRELWFFLVIVACLTTGMVYFLGMP